MAAPAAPVALRAVAATAPTAFVVQLVTSGSSTAPAQSPALVMMSVVLAASVHETYYQEQRTALRLIQRPTLLVRASLLVNVNLLRGFLGCFVRDRGPRGYVFMRARGSASHSLGLTRSDRAQVAA